MKHRKKIRMSALVAKQIILDATPDAAMPAKKRLRVLQKTHGQAYETRAQQINKHIELDSMKVTAAQVEYCDTLENYTLDELLEITGMEFTDD
jgi:hypothetical protein